MALFEGIPNLIETPAESVRKAQQGGAVAGQLFGRALEGSKDRRLQESQFERTMEFNRQKAAEANELQRKYYAANLRVDLARWETAKAVSDARLAKLNEEASEAPIMADFLEKVQGVASYEEAAALTPNPKLTGERLSQATSLITQKRLAMAELKRQQMEAEAAAIKAKDKADKIEQYNKWLPHVRQRYNTETGAAMQRANQEMWTPDELAIVLDRIDSRYFVPGGPTAGTGQGAAPSAQSAFDRFQMRSGPATPTPSAPAAPPSSALPPAGQPFEIDVQENP